MRIAELEFLVQDHEIGWSGDEKWGSTGRDGKKYNWHQFGQQMMALPFYLFIRGEAYAYFIINIIATALTAVLLMRTLILLGFRVRPSALTALAFGTATLSFFYASKTPHEQALAVAAVMGAVYYAVRYREGMGRGNLYRSVIAIGLGFTVRYDVILSLLPIAMYLYLGRDERKEQKLPLMKAALISAALLAPFFLANFTYNYARFGNFLNTGYIASTMVPEKMFGFEYLVRGLIGSLVSPGRSIFLFSPVLFLFPFYVGRFRKRVGRDFFVLWGVINMLYLIFFSCYFAWDGDRCFGPRHFVILIPFLIMPLAEMFESFKKSKIISKTVIVSVLAFSLFAQAIFVSSESGISSGIKYGVDFDSSTDLRYTARDFGARGSWEWLWSFFPLKYSQFLNQFKVFRYTYLLNSSEAGMRAVIQEILNSDYPYLVNFIPVMEEFDLWWMQEHSKADADAAILLAVVSLVSLLQLLRVSAVADGTARENGHNARQGGI